MAFWDNLSQKASETTSKAMMKAKEMSDIAKINSLISEEETRINNTYYQIGKLYATLHGNDYEEEFSGMIVTLAESEDKVKSYRQQIQDIKGVVRCQKCGAEVQLGVAFCSSCGTSMPKVQTVDTENMIRCENCGVMIKKGVRFCTSCGKPMNQLIVSEPIIESEIEVEEKNKVCPNCGHEIESDAAFCTECGTKI